ncbi:MAG: outer membrane protein assembly factor BamD [Chlorobi bacterium]|nr:outer membrane protein assembly factor BamD [Chlorobiota bacterium]
MKKILIPFVLALLTVSCGQYTKVLNSNDPMAQYSLAQKLYEQGKYAKAERLFALADEPLKTHPKYERLKFLRAMSLYHLKQYRSAGYQFRSFTRLFPKSSKKEEADFYIVKCYYNLTPEYYRDLYYGEKTLEEADRFLREYPGSSRTDEINRMVKDITYRFEKKDFEKAKLYYHLGYWKAAIKSFNLFLADHPGSPLREEAHYLRFMSAAQLALNSVESKQKERAEEALKYYEKFKNLFPQSQYLKKMTHWKDKLDQLLQEEKTEEV